MKDDFCKDFIRTGRGDWRAWCISHSTMRLSSGAFHTVHDRLSSTQVFLLCYRYILLENMYRQLTHSRERAGGSIVLLRLARRAAARYRRVPMDQSRGCGVAHTAAAAAVVVEQEIVRVVRAAAVDPRDRTAHHNQALSFGAEF